MVCLSDRRTHFKIAPNYYSDSLGLKSSGSKKLSLHKMEYIIMESNTKVGISFGYNTKPPACVHRPRPFTNLQMCLICVELKSISN